MTPQWIAAGAVYVPGCAVPTRKGPRRVCASDEDAVTLAVEAGARALSCWPATATPIGALVVALRDKNVGSEGGIAAHIVREALGLANTIRVVSMSGTDTLSGLAAIQAGQDGATLVIAAEAGLDQSAAAAAALIVVPSGSDPDSDVRVDELARASGLTHERWRGSEQGGREPDRRFLGHRYRALAAQLIGEDIAAELGDVSQLYVAAPSTSDHREIATALGGTEPSGDLVRVVAADRGIAGPLAAIVEAAVRRPDNGRGVLYASGTGQSVILEIVVPAGAQRRFSWFEDPQTRLPSPSVPEGPELSFPLESPFYVRNWDSMLRLEAACCTECGYLALPASQRPICPNCQARSWTSCTLPRQGRVYASLENEFLPTGFPKSLVFVLGELSNGFKYWAPMPAEIGRDDVQIGDSVRLALRSFTERDGIAAYGMKYLPVAGGAITDSDVALSTSTS